MRLVRVTRGYRPRTDGWSRHATRLSEIQSDMGHDVIVLQPELPSRRSERLREVRVGGPEVNNAGTLGVLAFSAASMVALLAINRWHPPDLIHAHGDALEIASVALCARLMRVPMIATLHGGPAHTAPFWQVLRLAVPHVRGFVAVSPMIRDELVRAGAPESDVLVQSSGVDLERLATTGDIRDSERVRLGRSKEDHVVLFAGRLEPSKGIDTLLRALHRLPDDVHAVIAGSGSLHRQLERAADGSRTQLLGGVPQERIATLLAAADVLVVPSVDYGGTIEGTPTVILEAFAAGVPVIASRAGGIPATVLHERTGLLVPQRDDVALAAAIRRLREDSPLRVRIVREARAFAQRQDWVLVAERITEFSATTLRRTR